MSTKRNGYEQSLFSHVRAERHAENAVAIRSREETLAGLDAAKQSLGYSTRRAVFRRRAILAGAVFATGGVAALAAGAPVSAALVGLAATGWMTALRLQTGTVPIYFSKAAWAVLSAQEAAGMVEQIRGAGGQAAGRLAVASVCLWLLALSLALDAARPGTALIIAILASPLTALVGGPPCCAPSRSC